ncbi:MAG: hypothetical protein E7329_07500 [Clostridiales bacterium]|nr:hypothetical protein [Clostridiales bacterium]
MKRIENACLEQTLLFSVHEHISLEADREANHQEYAQYKRQMDQKRMKYQVLAEEENADGSLLVKVRRQYNTYPCDQYIK